MFSCLVLTMILFLIEESSGQSEIEETIPSILLICKGQVSVGYWEILNEDDGNEENDFNELVYECSYDSDYPREKNEIYVNIAGRYAYVQNERQVITLHHENTPPEFQECTQTNVTAITLEVNLEKNQHAELVNTDCDTEKCINHSVIIQDGGTYSCQIKNWSSQKLFVHVKVNNNKHVVTMEETNSETNENFTTQIDDFTDERSTASVETTSSAKNATMVQAGPNFEAPEVKESTNNTFNITLAASVSVGTTLGLAILFVLFTYIFIYKCRKRKQTNQRVVSIELISEPGPSFGIRNGLVNTATPLYEQIEKLSYDKKWEVPRKNLRMGEIIGSGCFGEVRKAELIKTNNSEVPRAVAVKVAKGRSKSNVEALRAEIKVMAFIGNHANVLNILGACTKDVDKGQDLCLITELCTHGNLQKYLLKNRGLLQSQLYIQRNEIDPMKCSTLSASYKLMRRILLDGLRNPEEYLQEVSAAEERYIFTLDLISWAYQICSGMVFLASKRVIHRDLACRNILLTDGKLVKICDFGLAKSLYEEKQQYYRIQNNILLPRKWMAIESLEYGIFTSQSDVWSFGVLLWELFTLGKLPYNGDTVDDNFIFRLRHGYRLQKPKEQPEFIHSMMFQCFRIEPSHRPTFQQLEQCIRLKVQELLQRIQISETNSTSTYHLQPDILDTISEDSNHFDISSSMLQMQSGYLPMNKQERSLPDYENYAEYCV